jgi:YbbR domain-containing protein
MLRRFLSFFYTDVHWKLLALGLSGVLWLVSLADLDREENRFYSRILFLDNQAVLDNENVVFINPHDLPEGINIGVRAPASLHNELMLEALLDIRASIDFRAVIGQEVHDAEGPIDLALPVSVNLPPDLGFVLFNVTPSEVIVRLDARVRSTFPIEVSQTGGVGAGTELQGFRMANTFVTVTGPRSVVERVARVQVLAEIQGLTESTVRTVRLAVYDANGYEITDQLELSVSETNLFVDIFPVHQVAITPEITGTLAPGFAVAEITTYPAEVKLVGTAERLAEIEAIVPVFDLYGANQNSERVFPLAEWLPEGVSLAQGERTAAMLTVVVEPIQERVFTISRGDIAVFGYALYAVLGDPASVSVTVSGPASLIALLTPADVAVQMNLRNWPIGIHHVPLRVHLPPGLRTVGTLPSLEVQIYEPAAPDEGSEDDAPDDFEPPDEDNTSGDTTNPGDFPGEANSPPEDDTTTSGGDPSGG